MKLRFLAAAIFFPAVAFAQNPPSATPAPAPANLFSNGDFGKYTDGDNLWDGVDNDGFLAGRRGKAEIILENAKVDAIPMPLSVQAADLNGDGLIDLLTVEPSGYVRVYFNSGTPTEPKFTNAEIVPVFLRRVGAYYKFTGNLPKVALGDFSKNGTMDLVVGNYLGHLFLIKNKGNPTVPEWRQPPTLNSVMLPTTRDGHLWANLLSPAVYDWDGDGKLDVLVGEGSYSANAIHLLRNMGSNGAPKFSEDGHDYVAYGYGREQLNPAVVDYNGDGFPDLLVGDRSGKVSVYLSEGPYKKGIELKRQDDPIKFGGVTEIGLGNAGEKCVSVSVGDLNGDGLFDIIIGETNGRIAVSYNTGTKTEPKFGPLAELKGTDVYKKGSVRSVADWDIGFGYGDGNFLGYSTVVTPEEDPEAAPSKHVLKFSYCPVLNKVIRKPRIFLSGTGTANDFPEIVAQFWYPNNVPTPNLWEPDANAAGGMVDSNIAIFRRIIGPKVLKPGANYMLSFKVKGRGVKMCRMRYSLAGWLVKDLSKAGSDAAAKNIVSDVTSETADFAATPAWTVVTKQINFSFDKEKDLNTPDKWKTGGKLEYRGIFEFRGDVSVDEGALYIDDVKLTPM